MAFTVGYPCVGYSTYGVAKWRCQGHLKSTRLPSLMPGTLLRNRFGLGRLETVARPDDMNHGAVIGKHTVGERDFCAGALQQGAGDEYPEPEPAMLALDLIR